MVRSSSVRVRTCKRATPAAGVRLRRWAVACDRPSLFALDVDAYALDGRIEVDDLEIRHLVAGLLDQHVLAVVDLDLVAGWIDRLTYCIANVLCNLVLATSIGDVHAH